MKTIMPDGADSVFFPEVAKPELFKDAALCRVTHGIISAGTERGIILACKGKSREQIQQANNRLGYTGAGIVEDVNGDLGLSKGQRVAFYGAPYVSHSEYLCVPKHLIYPIPDNCSNESATFCGLGAIAMHGLRQGHPTLGEICVVSGMGLIGNLCAQMALLTGCRVIVSDFEASRLNLFKESVPENADYLAVSPDQLNEAVADITHNIGADKVYLCMSTRSADPMEQALQQVRRGGQIIVVGVLDIHISREPFFMKEATVTISRAGGPGRYDPGYEKDGYDYPYQYIRWTEGRNVEESLRLIASGKLNLSKLVSGRYPIDKATEAYDQVVNGKPALGFVLDWGVL